MITEIVYFDMTNGTTREKALKLYRTNTPAWSKNSDLIQKFYFYDQNNNRGGGGVYIDMQSSYSDYHCATGSNGCRRASQAAFSTDQLKL